MTNDITAYKAYWGWDIKFPGAAKKTVPYKTPDRWKISRSSGTWKLYVNETFVASGAGASSRIARVEIRLPADNAPILIGDWAGAVVQ